MQGTSRSRQRRSIPRSASTVPFVTTSDSNPLAKFTVNPSSPAKKRVDSLSEAVETPSSLTPLVYNRAVLQGLANKQTVLLSAVTSLRRTSNDEAANSSSSSSTARLLERFRAAPNPMEGLRAELPFFNNAHRRLSLQTPMQPSGTLATVLAHHKNSEMEKKAIKAATERLEAYYKDIQMSSMINCGEMNKVQGMTVVPEYNMLGVVHDDTKISIFAVIENWQLQNIATFNMVELDRRHKTQALQMNGAIAATDKQVFVLNKTATRIMRFNFQLFEAAHTPDAYEVHEVTAEQMAKSLVGNMLGLTVIQKFNELYTSTGDHIVVYSIESGRELLRSAVVQPPSSVVTSWSNSGICYAIPGNDNAAVRIKFFRENKKHDGYDVKLSNTKGLFLDRGAAYDCLSDSLLIVSNDVVHALGSIESCSSNCCVTLPTVDVIANLGDLGIADPIALAILEPRLHGDDVPLPAPDGKHRQETIHEEDGEDDEDEEIARIKRLESRIFAKDKSKSENNSNNNKVKRSLFVILDGASSSLYVFS